MKKILAGLGGLIIIGYILSTGLVQVGETELALITQFGSPVRVADQAGLTFKLPDPVQTVVRLDRRLQVIDADPGEFLTRDRKNLVVGTFVLWRIEDGRKFLQSVRNPDDAQRCLMDLVGSELGGRHWKRTLDIVFEHRRARRPHRRNHGGSNRQVPTSGAG